MNLNRSQEIWIQSSVLILACLPFFGFALSIDTRLLNDINIWVKPLKFHVSTAMHLLTLAIVIHFLPPTIKQSKWILAIAYVTGISTLLELGLIDMQAFRGVASHFNFATAFDVIVYSMMGVVALLLTVPALFLGVIFARAPLTPQLTPGLKLSIVLGLILGCIFTLGIAGYMSSLPSGHWVNAPTTDQGGVPLVGWTKQGGDLRVPHFFATHMLQVLPIIGWLADKLFKNKARVIVLASTLVLIAITLLTLQQALAGIPLIAH